MIQVFKKTKQLDQTGQQEQDVKGRRLFMILKKR